MQTEKEADILSEASAFVKSKRGWVESAQSLCSKTKVQKRCVCRGETSFALGWVLSRNTRYVHVHKSYTVLVQLKMFPWTVMVILSLEHLDTVQRFSTIFASVTSCKTFLHPLPALCCQPVVEHNSTTVIVPVLYCDSMIAPTQWP